MPRARALGLEHGRQRGHAPAGAAAASASAARPGTARRGAQRASARRRAGHEPQRRERSVAEPRDESTVAEQRGAPSAPAPGARLEQRPRRLDQRPYGTPDGHAVSHARQPRQQVEVAGDLRRRLERPSSSPRISWMRPRGESASVAELDVGRARREAEPAVHARVERRLVDRHALVLAEARPKRARRRLFPSVATP